MICGSSIATAATMARVSMPEMRRFHYDDAFAAGTIAAGGTLDPVSAFPMTPGDWRRHFGSAWMLLSEAKQRFDPDHVLTPGYELF